MDIAYLCHIDSNRRHFFFGSPVHRWWSQWLVGWILEKMKILGFWSAGHFHKIMGVVLDMILIWLIYIYIYYIPWYTNDISNVDQVGHIADISFVIRGCFTALDDLSVGHFTSNTAWLGLVGSQRLWVTTQHTRPCDSAAANGGRSFHIHLKGFQVVLQPGGYEMIFLRFSNHLTFVFTNL
jgi:hypothetical protein